jgi:hypothetical protein
MARTITLAEVVAKGVCPEAVALFQQHFGESVEATEANALAVASVFNWDTAARALLSPQAREAFNTVTAEPRKAHDAAMADARKTLNAAIAEPVKAFYAAAEPYRHLDEASDYKAYDAATAEAREAYAVTTAEAREAYAVTTVEASKTFNAAMALSFCRAYNEDV